MARPQIIAHRGASSERPENTLAAVLRALELGAEAIELDVHATRDRAVVVHHDPVIAGGPALASCTLAETARYRVRGEPIPTLDAVLTAVGDAADVYVELKARDVEALAVDVIRRSPAPRRCAIHSFDHTAVLRARRAAPEIPGGVLLASYLVKPEDALRDADARDYWSDFTFVDEELVRRVHAARGRVVAWTPAADEDILRLARLGVDGVCANDVRRLRDLLHSL